MNSKKVNIAIIGCGRIAGHHCESIRKTPGCQLTAVCDLDAAKARNYGEKYSVPYFTNYHEMLEAHPEINTVAIMTPSGMHFEHSMEIMSLYSKNIIVEKPTFLRSSHLEEAYAFASKNNLRIFPVFQNRYNKAVRRVKKSIEQNELGDIRIISVRVRWCREQRYYGLAPWRGTYSQDGGALTNQGIHHIDLLRYLGGEVENVNATMRTLGADIEVEDTVVATFKYASGAVGVLEVTTAARPGDFEASLSIVGSKGLAQIGGIAVNELQTFTPAPQDCSQHSEDFSGNVYGNGHVELYQSIANCIITGNSYLISKDDCSKTTQLLHAFYRSDEQKAEVVVKDAGESTRLGQHNENLAQLYRTPVITIIRRIS